MLRSLVVAALYLAAQMLADVLSLKVVTIAGLPIDAGTFIYPITFTLRDLVHKTTGARGARAIIVTAAIANLVMAGMFWLVARMPGDASVGPQEAFGLVLAPVWRITLASIAAEVVAELLDTEAYHFWVTRITTRYQWARVLVSNSVSVPIDSVVFAFGAFGGVLPLAVVWAIVLSNVLVKGATTLLSLPLIYAVPVSTEA